MNRWLDNLVTAVKICLKVINPRSRRSSSVNHTLVLYGSVSWRGRGVHATIKYIHCTTIQLKNTPPPQQDVWDKNDLTRPLTNGRSAFKLKACGETKPITTHSIEWSEKKRRFLSLVLWNNWYLKQCPMKEPNVPPRICPIILYRAEFWYLIENHFSSLYKERLAEQRVFQPDIKTIVCSNVNCCWFGHTLRMSFLKIYLLNYCQPSCLIISKYLKNVTCVRVIKMWP